MGKLLNKKPELVVALDIGTTKVVAIAGMRNDLGQIEVLGYGRVKSEGVLRGVVANIDKTVKAISDAVDMAEKRAKYEFQVVHVGIAGQHIRSLHHRGILTRDDAQAEIRQHEIEQMISEMYKLALPPGDQILHVIPQEFVVDEEEGIKDPVGMSGARVEGNFHVITGKMAAANNIMRCIQRARLKVSEMILEPIGSASSVLSKEEMEAGVALVDIGGGTSDITIFQDGIIRHTAVIPFGGNVITKDIKEGCSVMHDQAEKLKTRFGSALASEIVDNRIITIPGIKGREAKEISEKNLAKIIQARMEEIFDYILFEIRRTGYERKLIAGLVLTGGGSLLKNIEYLAQYHTGFSARIGWPNENLKDKKDKELSSPIYATSIGLLIHGIEHLDIDGGEIVKHEDELEEAEGNEGDEQNQERFFGRFVNKLFEGTREFFETKEDIEF
ncbi:MAG: cell division protein FtsA [Saprospiraceae bacterium]|nr:cell division protein FtsA [Saprospiraceae bacterium]